MTTPDDVAINLSGRSISVEIRRNRQAKRLILRVDPQTENRVIVTLPYGASASEGLAMVHRKADWIIPRLGQAAAKVLFADGVVLPFLGEDHVLCHHPGRRGAVWRENGGIHVAGGAEHLSRRVGDWLRRQARDKLSAHARFYADTLGVAVKRVTIRDTRSRWGSCSAGGGLSFSWRLVLAPEPVLDYVAAHEAAHLIEMNHGPAYWRLVETLVGDYGTHRQWLKRHGPELHRYG